MNTRIAMEGRSHLIYLCLNVCAGHLMLSSPTLRLSNTHDLPWFSLQQKRMIYTNIDSVLQDAADRSWVLSSSVTLESNYIYFIQMGLEIILKKSSTLYTTLMIFSIVIV